ncbi:DUF2059 domain-containing protein [Mucilaginibacter sp. Bleaf8]|uniref:DUF2059 domain-containing protein n=1 Tax=Mucilaginibacter sp. Bleaf8 TaxID=2834430 RepID=UPI001BCAB3A2|nr:DUF2059 domain-containing protein [Mucilaginibacter sp. Bleaf8]MBS7566189.1 DUF2059 domain-containing protein [Mucilaginibacter sp. Bleaf8]
MKFQLKHLAVCLLIVAGTAAKAQTAIPASRLKTAEALVDASGVSSQLTSMYSNMVDVSSAQVPADKKAKFKELMMGFLSKYMSYSALKPDLAKLYAQEFSEPELKQITQFYLTPAGKKMTQKMALLQQKGMQIGQQKMQAHLPEFQAQLKKAFPEMK